MLSWHSPERGSFGSGLSYLLQNTSALNGPGQVLLPHEIVDAVDHDREVGHSQDRDESSGVALSQDDDGKEPRGNEELVVVVIVRVPFGGF